MKHVHVIFHVDELGRPAPTPCPRSAADKWVDHSNDEVVGVHYHDCTDPTCDHQPSRQLTIGGFVDLFDEPQT